VGMGQPHPVRLSTPSAGGERGACDWRYLGEVHGCLSPTVGLLLAGSARRIDCHEVSLIANRVGGPDGFNLRGLHAVPAS
jgi:hypothetical protein